MNRSLSFFLATLALMFVGCGSSSDKSEEENNGTIGAEIAEDYNRQIDKAADVEAQLLESKKNIDDAVENAEGAVEEDDDGVKN